MGLYPASSLHDNLLVSRTPPYLLLIESEYRILKCRNFRLSRFDRNRLSMLLTNYVVGSRDVQVCISHI